MINLRPYQQQAIDALPESGKTIIALATGLGKTVTISRIPRHGRMLILAHREELVNQPRKYFNCSYGVEMAKHKSDGEEVVGASVQSLVRRLNRFEPDAFDVIVVDECHHSSSPTYKKILNHFKPRLLVGITATVKRADNIRLDDVFDNICYYKDLIWGIENGYLSNIECLRVNVGYDLSRVRTKLGDFNSSDLNKEMAQNQQIKAIAQAHDQYAIGQTLVFAVSVKHCEMLADHIKGAEIITGKIKDRESILNAYKRKEIKCVINCEVLTEGTDIQNIETIIMARPTKSQTLYMQCIGRGTRLYEGKEKLRLIDIVGNTGNHSLCTAPTLLGIDMSVVPKSKQDEIQGNIFELPDKIETAMDTPDSWIRNVEIVKLFAKSNGYSLHDVNYFKMPTGDLVVSLKDRKWYKIDAIDKLERTTVTRWDGKKRPDMKAQDAFDFVYTLLQKYHSDEQYIWDLAKAKGWGRYKATDKQKALIERLYPDVNVANLTKLQASHILNRKFHR